LDQGEKGVGKEGKEEIEGDSECRQGESNGRCTVGRGEMVVEVADGAVGGVLLRVPNIKGGDHHEEDDDDQCGYEKEFLGHESLAAFCCVDSDLKRHRGGNKNS
jgi:hypothetical protein